MVTTQNKQVIEEFEYMRNMAELRALLKHAEMQPLNDNQYLRAMELKELLFEKEVSEKWKFTKVI